MDLSILFVPIVHKYEEGRMVSLFSCDYGAAASAGDFLPHFTLLSCPADAKTAAMGYGHIWREGPQTSSHFRLVGLLLLSLAPFASSSIHFASSSSSSQHSLPTIRFVRFIFHFRVSLLQADKALAMASQPSPAIPLPFHFHTGSEQKERRHIRPPTVVADAAAFLVLCAYVLSYCWPPFPPLSPTRISHLSSSSSCAIWPYPLRHLNLNLGIPAAAPCLFQF
jgi:hypothetical protein